MLQVVKKHYKLLKKRLIAWEQIKKLSVIFFPALSAKSLQKTFYKNTHLKNYLKFKNYCTTAKQAHPFLVGVANVQGLQDGSNLKLGSINTEVQQA